MNILILGRRRREHALAWAVLQNPKCDRLIVAPGNAGIAEIAECAELDILDGGAVAAFAEENAIDFVIVGPEAPLAAGVADRLREAGLARLRPRRGGRAARGVEGLHQGDLRRLRCPDRRLGAVRRRRRGEGSHVRAQGAPIVVKADGLAAGQGVVVAAMSEPRRSPRSTRCSAGRSARRAQRW
jgi:phosphoribosylamine---glycine ligase